MQNIPARSTNGTTALLSFEMMQSRGVGVYLVFTSVDPILGTLRDLPARSFNLSALFSFRHVQAVTAEP